MTFDTDETSVEGSAPRDAFEIIVSNGKVYRLTSSVTNVLVDGNTYTPGTIIRSEFGVSSIAKEHEFSISMDVAHELPQRYLAQSVPPQRITVNVYRVQPSGYQQIWRGYVTSMNIEGRIASFRVPSVLAEMLKRRLPVITVGRNCQHVLYEIGCNKSVAGFEVTRTVSSVDGPMVYLNSAPNGTNNWAQFGELILLGERRTIKSQIGATIEMQLPIYELKAGDSVTIRAGCDHTLDTCLSKFSNVPNFGGLPELPRNNPFIPDGFGIYESS